MLRSNLILAVIEIRKNLFRSLLTILGVVIGVAAVIAIVTLGAGATARITKSFTSLGTNVLIVMPGGERRGPPGPPMGRSARPFTHEQVDAIRQIEGVDGVAPTQIAPALAAGEAGSRPSPVAGTTPDYFAMMQLEFTAGEAFDPEADDGPNQVVLGSRIATELLGEEPAIGDELTLGGEPFRVVGVLAKRDRGAFGLDFNGAIFVPSTAVDVFSGRADEVASIFVTVADVEQLPVAKESINALLREDRGLTGDQRSDFQIQGIEDIAKMIGEAIGTFTTVIGLIAAISLLVGGIGIMNVMLVTVTERTREIGVRLAIGAEPRDVMAQFLVEACVLTGLGGLTGIALGVAGGAAAARAIGLPLALNVPVLIGMFVFSVSLGVVFGLLPARRAARINPIEALRHE